MPDAGEENSSTSRQVEVALRESEKAFRLFVAATSDTVYKMSADWSELRHLAGKQFLVDTLDPSRTWLETYTLIEDHPAVRAAIQKAIRNKRRFELEHRIIRVDGTVGWTSSRAVPLLDARGEISEWIGAARDVTEHRRAEEALAGSEEKHHTLFDSIDEGVATIEVLFEVVLTSLLRAVRLQAML